MSETKKRKFHTPEYKAKVALEALRSGKTINQISQEFAVHPIKFEHALGQAAVHSIATERSTIVSGAMNASPSTPMRSRIDGSLGANQTAFNLLIHAQFSDVYSGLVFAVGRMEMRRQLTGCPLV